MLVSGCMLVAGRSEAFEEREASGSFEVSFVSAEGSEERLLETGMPGELNVGVAAQVERGELRLELLDAEGQVVLRVVGDGDGSYVGRGPLATDRAGRLRYRVHARNARDGSYAILIERR
jgi:hypothetical protein